MDAKVKGYCVKCRTMREMAKVNDIEMNTGRKAKKGVCTVCNTAIYKMMPKPKKEK